MRHLVQLGRKRWCRYLLCDLSQLEQTDHLEAARCSKEQTSTAEQEQQEQQHQQQEQQQRLTVGEHRPGPPHEFVQPAQLRQPAAAPKR